MTNDKLFVRVVQKFTSSNNVNVTRATLSLEELAEVAERYAEYRYYEREFIPETFKEWFSNYIEAQSSCQLPSAKALGFLAQDNIKSHKDYY